MGRASSENQEAPMRKLIIGLALAGGVLAVPATPAVARENPARAAARRACLQEYHAIGGAGGRPRGVAPRGAAGGSTPPAGAETPPPPPPPPPHPQSRPP